MDNLILKKVGQRLRELRKQKGLTQEELAERCGFHYTYIGGVERAEKNISLINLQKLCDGLQVQVQEVFNYEFSINLKQLSSREKILREIYGQLLELKAADLKKVSVFLNEII
ncbi:helix-turn-helix domain-containing protein [Paenibacillus sp. LMG 31456]|uniref:Helix-turn-helix domain-containing protein n=1 Tax=Paenibacillus foliorum TaxID=2654974 RepID=A0A972GSS6_9BACL|nr:helix-turn-helix transcriptional regulator [Paenibacillus foliorum]NOU96214.1 helix-turn-helix domain-containing protein [Paenibacillus foliorum]